MTRDKTDMDICYIHVLFNLCIVICFAKFVTFHNCKKYFDGLFLDSIVCLFFSYYCHLLLLLSE